MHPCPNACRRTFSTTTRASYKSITDKEEHVLDAHVKDVGEHGHRETLRLHHRSRPRVPESRSHLQDSLQLLHAQTLCNTCSDA